MLTKEAPENYEKKETINSAIKKITLELQAAGVLGKVKEQLGLLQELAGKNKLGEMPTDGGELFIKERERLSKILEEMRSCIELDNLLTTTTNLIRDSLEVERVLIYKFDDEKNGKVIAESLATGWTPAEGETLPAVCFGGYEATEYKEKRTVILADVGENGLTPYQTQLLEKFQVKASIALPIFQEEKVWGLLIAQQCVTSKKWEEADINLLENITRELKQFIEANELQKKLQKQLERETGLAKLVQKIKQYSDLPTIFKAITRETRQIIKADRVVVYQFNPDFSGEVIAESAGAEWVSVIQLQQIDEELYSTSMSEEDQCYLKNLGKSGPSLEADTYLRDTQGGKYIKGKKISVINDVYTQGYSQCYLESLEKYQAKAYIIVPIYQNEKIWGLFGAYQNWGPRTWQQSELNVMLQLSGTLGMALQQVKQIEQLQTQSEQMQVVNEQERVTANIINRISESLDLNSIFKNTTQEVRQLLKADRVGVYRFNPDFSGEFISESVASGWVSVIQEQKMDASLINDFSQDENCTMKSWGVNGNNGDTYLKETAGGAYARGVKFKKVDDIYQAGFSPCYINVLEKYQCRAYIIVPIFQEEQLWGLFAAYQNSGARNWQQWEVEIMIKIASQLSIAVKQAEYVEQLEKTAKLERGLAAIADRIRFSRELMVIFDTATQETRKLLEVDRCAIYRFNSDWSGDFIAESTTGNWVKLMENMPRVLDTHLQETEGGRYKNKECFAVNDIYKVGHADCHIELLEQFEAKAYAIAPIFAGDQLWGLLAIYQNSTPRQWQQIEINALKQIGVQIGSLMQELSYVDQLRIKSELERGLAAIADRIRFSRELKVIFDIATQETRRLLKVERCAIYRFNPDWSGEFIAESTAGGWIKLMKTIPYVLDTNLQETQGGRYQDNECLAVDDIYQAGHSDCHVELLEQFEAKAYAIAPIFVGEKLWGLFAIYQNSKPRQWQEMEVNTLKQVGGQIGSLMQELSYIDQLRLKSEDIAKVAQRESNFIRLLAKINQKIIEQSQQKLNLESLFKTSCQELRKLLKTDRVAVIEFESDWKMRVIQEDVATGYTKLVASEAGVIEDPEIQETNGGKYSQQKNLVVNDIYNAEISSFEFEFLETIGAKACAIIPIFKGNQLWGLLATYQANPRVWEEGEVRLLYQATQQLEVSIQLAEYLARVEQQSQELSNAVEREKAAKEEIQQRVIDLLNAVQATSVGDLTVRANVTEDEVGTIAAAYNITLDSLREIIMQVQNAALQVADTTSNSNTAIEKLAEQARNQFEALYQALDQIQEMVNATEQTTNNAEAVNKALNQANNILTTGDVQMNKTVDSILGIRSTVQETSKRVKRLRESSQKISKVVSVIGDFAKQTNLLALNAALEATRAGEYGKGFAVVADEVRNLAHQSAEATTEIEKLVQEIQEETQEVATAMDTGIQQVVDGSSLVNETRQSLNDIVTATAEIDMLVEGITKATNIQTQQAESVTNVMTQVASISQDTAENSLKISSSFQELLAMAQQLQASAGQFRVN